MLYLGVLHLKLCQKALTPRTHLSIQNTCYDANCVIGLVRAAERCRSPAIIQMFPVTLAYGKGPFLQFCLNAAREASVPIAVSLDHATDPEHLELALGLAERGIAFDSIMVDASHAETDEENIVLAPLRRTS
ncbi:putative fructose-bisphosphate aldolase [Grifola frondosa]|uniref:Fructose-bisphosphate aldolase n=1 Tax=Grifola frondosa TaxID=5627 RepID=A0A1C7M4D7_GRIFR|nr:putative fructose-bisphosphate aldolase [Grifola frondosa]